MKWCAMHHFIAGWGSRSRLSPRKVWKYCCLGVRSSCPIRTCVTRMVEFLRPSSILLAMRIDYHRTALPGPLVARANVIKIGSTLATAEAQVFDNSEKLIASGRGAYLTQSR
jgi:acyl-coenzyme A thioesterase PaaI-like protein